MGIINERRQRTDFFLNKMDTQAIYLALLMDQSTEEATDKFEQSKESLKQEIDDSIAKVEELDEVTDDKKQSLKGKFEHLQLQLSLGKAETKEAFEKERKNIRKAINELEMEMQTDMDVFDDALGEAWDEFDAELDEVTSFFNEDYNKVKTGFKESKQKLIDDLEQFKAKVKAKRNQTKQKVSELKEEFEKDLGKMWEYFIHKM
jgi:F0F1-type ATP synthase membrane subunit b/b'